MRSRSSRIGAGVVRAFAGAARDRSHQSWRGPRPGRQRCSRATLSSAHSEKVCRRGVDRFPVYCGATAAPFTDVREELAQALIRPVRWRETFRALLAAGAEDFVETGPGTVLSKLARRITKETANA